MAQRFDRKVRNFRSLRASQEGEGREPESKFDPIALALQTQSYPFLGHTPYPLATQFYAVPKQVCPNVKAS